METRQTERLPLHLLQASWHNSGWGAACPSHWTWWLSWLSSCPASHLADCSNSLASWSAFHLGSQIPAQKFLKCALCSLKTIEFSEIKLGNKAKFSLFPVRKTEVKKQKIVNETKIALDYLFSYHSTLCGKKKNKQIKNQQKTCHGNITCISKYKGLYRPFSLCLGYLVF